MTEDRLTLADIDQKEIIVPRGLRPRKTVHTDPDCHHVKKMKNPDWVNADDQDQTLPVCASCSGHSNECNQGGDAYTTDPFEYTRALERAAEKEGDDQ